MEAIEKYEDKLLQLGFLKVKDHWMYEYSDFETLEVAFSIVDTPKGRKCLKTPRITIKNYFTNEVYLDINYEMYFYSLCDFLSLMNKLYYKIPEPIECDNPSNAEYAACKVD